MKDFFDRYPAVILGIVSALLQMLTAYGLPLSADQTTWINAAVAAVLGLAMAAAVAHDRLLPAILGLGQAGFGLAIAFGAHVSQDQVATAMAVLAAVVAAFTHTQVTAAVNAHGQRVPKKPMFRLAA
jgi:hypothetical protein